MSLPAGDSRVPHGRGQHRCHARLADASHCLLTLQLGSFPGRVSLWTRCLASEVGSEPSEPFLLDPLAQRLRFRDRDQPAGAAPK